MAEALGSPDWEHVSALIGFALPIFDAPDVSYVFDSVEHLKTAPQEFPLDSFVSTRSYRSPGDGGGSTFRIEHEAPTFYGWPAEYVAVPLQCGRSAVLYPVNGVVNTLQLGWPNLRAPSTALRDDSVALREAILLRGSREIVLAPGTYELQDGIVLDGSALKPGESEPGPNGKPWVAGKRITGSKSVMSQDAAKLTWGDGRRIYSGSNVTGLNPKLTISQANQLGRRHLGVNAFVQLTKARACVVENLWMDGRRYELHDPNVHLPPNEPVAQIFSNEPVPLTPRDWEHTKAPKCGWNWEDGNGVNVRASHGIRISHLQIQDVWGAGVSIGFQSSDVIAEDSSVYRTRHTAYTTVWASDITIRRCKSYVACNTFIDIETHNSKERVRRYVAAYCEYHNTDAEAPARHRLARNQLPTSETLCDAVWYRLASSSSGDLATLVGWAGGLTATGPLASNIADITYEFNHIDTLGHRSDLGPPESVVAVSGSRVAFVQNMFRFEPHNPIIELHQCASRQWIEFFGNTFLEVGSSPYDAVLFISGENSTGAFRFVDNQFHGHGSANITGADAVVFEHNQWFGFDVAQSVGHWQTTCGSPQFTYRNYDRWTLCASQYVSVQHDSFRFGFWGSQRLDMLIRSGGSADVCGITYQGTGAAIVSFAARRLRVLPPMELGDAQVRYFGSESEDVPGLATNGVRSPSIPHC